jgi:3,4-dehydroadipyl-CoA semialdehyde dehydrogenase
MQTLRSYVLDRWHDGGTSTVTLVDPSTEEELVALASGGIDFAAALAHARDQGGPALRALTFAERGELLRAMSKLLREHRDELLDISRRNNGTTKGDGAFDVDGATYSLGYYGKLGVSLGGARLLAEDEGEQLGRSEAFWGRHVLVPRQGVAVHINAFNFPAWGFAEKAACALLAGVPVITKPATSTAWLAVRCVELIVEAGILPAGALQLICGSPGDLLDRLEPQDVVAFTGSAATARTLRTGARLVAAAPRFNVEADSMNAAVLAADVTEGPVFDLFVKEVVREMTQKAGQKCTAVRRIVVPAPAVDRVRDALAEKLAAVVTGNPADPSVTMGPLASARQLDSAREGIELLSRQARIVHGTGRRVDGAGSPPGAGFFIEPTLLLAEDARAADDVHRHEVFGPVATLLPYDGGAAEAAELVALGGGMLVTSVYSDDDGWLGEFLAAGASHAGRIYIGSSASAPDAPGSGVAMPQSLHGGPGHAGGGEELGGLVGVKLYMQRVALQGARQELERLLGAPAD